jgi:hypothetical protein
VKKWVKPESSFATGASGRVTRGIQRQQARDTADEADRTRQDRQLTRSKADKVVKQQRRRG